MGKIWEFVKKWAFVGFLCCMAVGLLFALGCSVYTATVRPSVGIVGCIFNTAVLVFVVGWICSEIKDVKELEKWIKR